MEKHYINPNELDNLCRAMWDKIKADSRVNTNSWLFAYAIPRGGVSALYALKAASYAGISLETNLSKVDIFIDDIIDSGATRDRYGSMYPDTPFFALIDKTDPECPYKDKWVVFPWEAKDEDNAETVEDNVLRILQYVGEDIFREGLRETPKRVAKAWAEWCSGYDQDVAEHFKTFEDGAEGTDEMIVVKDIPFYSHCEHHMAPFFGTVSIGYIPDGKVLGLSKFSRIVEVFARRLQVQERVTTQIAQAIMDNMTPKGVAVVIKARHMCIESRGVCKHNSETVTQKLMGVFREPAVRAEFLSLVK